MGKRKKHPTSASDPHTHTDWKTHKGENTHTHTHVQAYAHTLTFICVNICTQTLTYIHVNTCIPQTHHITSSKNWGPVPTQKEFPKHPFPHDSEARGGSVGFPREGTAQLGKQTHLAAS